jgi:electron transfer flavoprotein alpha/beta subunit
MAAKKIAATVYKPADINMDTQYQRRSNVVRLFQLVNEMHCEFVQGKSVDELAQNLAEMLRSARIL